MKPVAYPSLSGAAKRKLKRANPAPATSSTSDDGSEKVSGKKRRELEHLAKRARKRARREERKLKASLESASTHSATGGGATAK